MRKSQVGICFLTGLLFWTIKTEIFVIIGEHSTGPSDVAHWPHPFLIHPLLGDRKSPNHTSTRSIRNSAFRTLFFLNFSVHYYTVCSNGSTKTVTVCFDSDGSNIWNIIQVSNIVLELLPHMHSHKAKSLPLNYTEMTITCHSTFTSSAFLNMHTTYCHTAACLKQHRNKRYLHMYICIHSNNDHIHLKSGKLTTGLKPVVWSIW